MRNPEKTLSGTLFEPPCRNKKDDMPKYIVSLVTVLGILLSHGFQTRAEVLITDVSTTGLAGALFNSEAWNADEFGNYSASGSAASSIGSGFLTASSSASLSFDEQNSTIDLSGESSAQTPTQESAGANSNIQIFFSLDRAYSFSIAGFRSGAYALPSFQLSLVPDNPNERYSIGDSGILSPGNFKLQGGASSLVGNLPEGSSTFQGYSAILSFVPLLEGDFNSDGDVNGGDFLAWQRNPGVGNLSDWQANYGYSVALSANYVSVPELSSLMLGVLSVLGLSIGRHRFIDR